MPTLIDDRNFSTRGYVAPTVYLRQGKLLPRYNYYATFNQAVEKWKYLNNAGGANVIPAGDVTFRPDGTAQTVGINVDFYILKDGRWQAASYAYMRGLTSWPPVIFRMYTTEGDGAFFALYSPQNFGMSATIVSNVSAEKIAALDQFHREVALLKYRYNSLVAFLNVLASRQLSGAEQQIFNEGSLMASNMNNQIRSIDGIEIIYSKDGKIGLPIIFLIALILILAAATAWTVSQIVTEKEKTRRINEAYELNKWVADKKIEVSTLVTSGEITPAQANSINQNLDTAQALAVKNANEASKPNKGLLTDVVTIVKWGSVAYLLSLFLKKKSNGQ